MNDPREIENPTPLERLLAEVREAGLIHTATVEPELVKLATATGRVYLIGFRLKWGSKPLELMDEEEAEEWQAAELRKMRGA